MRRPAFIFRARSPDRDRKTDDMRRREVVTTIDRQIADIAKEISGLSMRLQTAHATAVSLLDAASSYEHRTSDEEAEINRFEQSANAASVRIKTLQGQLELYNGLRLNLLNQDTEPPDILG